MTNISRIVALGGFIRCILKVSEAPGGSDFATLRVREKPKTGDQRTGDWRPEARSDECLEDPGPGRLNLSYSTRFGGSWERQIPGT